MKKLLFLTIVSLLAGGAAGCSCCGEGCSLTRLFNRRECNTCNSCGSGSCHSCNSCGSVESGPACGCNSGGEGDGTIIESTPTMPRPGMVIPGPDSYSFTSNK